MPIANGNASFINPTNVNTIVTLCGIIVTIVAIILAYKTNFFSSLKNFILKIFARTYVVKNDYYSSNFVVKNIKKSKKKIRFVCVRNIRVTEPDVIESLKIFLNKPTSKSVEIIALDPSIDDYVIKECMNVLPNPPTKVEQFRQQVKINYDSIFNLYKYLGVKEKEKFNYFEYNSLPLIHMCQFDSTIYVGFQLYHRYHVENSLLQYSVVTNEKSKLGKEILKQFEHLKEKKSVNLFESNLFKEYNER